MISGTKATGLRCKHCSQTTQHLGCGVGLASMTARAMAAKMTIFAPAEQPRRVMVRSAGEAYMLKQDRRVRFLTTF
jgi:predicted TPR repeat methyltransferase